MPDNNPLQFQRCSYDSKAIQKAVLSANKESVRKLVSAAAQFYASYDFSPLTRSYLDVRPVSKIEVPSALYDLLFSINAFASSVDSKKEVFTSTPKLSDALAHRPKKLSLDTLISAISLIIAFLSLVVPLIQASIQETSQNAQEQQVLAQLEEIQQFQAQESDLLRRIEEQAERQNDILEQFVLSGNTVAQNGSQLIDESNQLTHPNTHKNNSDCHQDIVEQKDSAHSG